MRRNFYNPTGKHRYRRHYSPEQERVRADKRRAVEAARLKRMQIDDPVGYDIYMRSLEAARRMERALFAASTDDNCPDGRIYGLRDWAS